MAWLLVVMIKQRLSRVALQLHLLAFVSASNEDLWLYECSFCSSTLWLNPLPSKVYFPYFRLSAWSLGCEIAEISIARRDWDKEGIQNLVLFEQLYRCPASFKRGPTFSLVFLLSLRYLQKSFLLPLIFLVWLNSAAASAFLTWISGCLNSVSVFLPGYLSMLPSSVDFLFMFDFG